MTQKPRHSIQKVVVLCNIPHTIIEGTCILCERDHAVNMLDVMEEAKAVIEELLKLIDWMGPQPGYMMADHEEYARAQAVLAKLDKERGIT